MNGEKPKQCRTCKGTGNLYSHPIHHKLKSGEPRVYYTYICRPCNTERFRKMRQDKSKRKVRNEFTYRSAAKNRHKVAARSALRYAMKTGRVIKATVCDWCSISATLQGHHDDYSKPLDVLWLCVTCHAKRHEELGTGYGRKSGTSVVDSATP